MKTQVLACAMMLSSSGTLGANMNNVHIAVDLGASGGRVALGGISDGRLGVEIVHRFVNAPVSVPTPQGPRLYWDVLGLWREIA